MNTIKEKILLELFTRGDITSDEYTNHLINEGFTDYSAEILKDDYDAIRRCEDDIKNGSIHPFEDTIKRFKNG